MAIQCSLIVHGGTRFEVVAPLGLTGGPYYPIGGLIQGSDGLFYGTTEQGGDINRGTAFKVSTDGAMTMLVSFNATNGAQPKAPLVQTSDGTIFGTTFYGGNSEQGTIFAISNNGDFSTVSKFSLNESGAWPLGGLAEGQDGKVYGTASGGGPGYGLGTVFRVESNGFIAVIANFWGTNGNCPSGGLTLARDGFFYGTTRLGGSADEGTVFRVSTNGNLVNLCSFQGYNGSWPQGELVQGPDGCFYGTTIIGGSDPTQSPYGKGFGTLFRVTPSGDLTSLASFHNTNGANPWSGLALGSDGNFYGCTTGGGDVGDGVLYQTTPQGALTRIYSMNYTNGNLLYSRLIQGTDGRFYGTSVAGGPMGSGNIFRLGVPMATTAMIRTSGTNPLIAWNAVIGQSYQAQYSSNLPSGNWSNLGGALMATNSTIALKDSVGFSPQRRFYRVLSLQ